jgi:hypothetical protein
MANAKLTPSTARQYPLFAEVAFNYTQLADTAVAVPAIKLPYGAQVVGGSVIVDTAFDTGTSAVLDVGDSTTANRYANDVNLKSAARTALTITGYVSDGAEIQITPVLVGTAATAGAGRVVVEYVISGRAHEVQTN